MKFEIGELVIKYVNKLVVEVTTMHGDADAYKTFEVVINKDRFDLLEEFITLLNEMLSLPWNDATELYKTLPMFNLWFYYDNSKIPDKYKDDEVKKDFNSSVCSTTWPNDVTCEDCESMFDSYRVYFYDENGNKRDVKVLND